MKTNQYDRKKEVQENVAAIIRRVQKAAEKCGKSADEIQIMAVTKTVDPEYVNAAMAAGITLLGENRAQELLKKYPLYQLQQTNIHFIGHLQKNKVKSIIEKVDMVESLDSLSLAAELQRRAESLQINLPVLLQVNIGREESKHGFMEDTLFAVVESLLQHSHLSIQGLMAIPPQGQNERYFARMQKLYVDMQNYFRDNINMQYLSMGMSQDFETAIAYGSNLVRICRAIFGERRCR